MKRYVMPMAVGSTFAFAMVTLVVNVMHASAGLSFLAGMVTGALCVVIGEFLEFTR